MSLGKWILGGLGFALGGPIGALIGVWIGSALDSAKQHSDVGSSRTNTSRGFKRPTQGDIRVSIIVLLASVIKADGQVLKSEINFIKPFLLRTFGEEGAKQALQLLKELLKQHIDDTAVARQVAQHVNYSTRLEFIHLLLQVANADGEIDSTELNVINRIATNMAIKVTRKDQGEANENIIRRFNRKVLQSGMMPLKKSQMRFSKPISKHERRLKAIIREARKAEKTERIKLGLK